MLIFVSIPAGDLPTNIFFINFNVFVSITLIESSYQSATNKYLSSFDNAIPRGPFPNGIFFIFSNFMPSITDISLLSGLLIKIFSPLFCTATPAGFDPTAISLITLWV